MKMNAQIAAAILAFAGEASAYWRMPCMGVSGVARVDPIVDPGKPAAHMHTIKGGNALSPTCTTEELLESECTSCQVKPDKSAYWTPQLYFMHEDGDVEIVEETAGHVTYYKWTPCYTHGGELVKPKAMPNGLRIVSGDTLRRNFTLPVPDPPLPWSGEDATQEALAQKAIGFNCMNYGGNPEDTLYRHFLPDKEWLSSNCPDGLRLEILFPYCWNGEDLDTPNHKSHMAFPSAGQNGGTCPEGYDVVVNQVLFETIYPTQNFYDKAGYFALSNGDVEGYGYHGDLFVAWKDNMLEKATKECGDPMFPPLNGQPEFCSAFQGQLATEQEQQECKMKLEGDLKYNMKEKAKALPGTNPIQRGPERATKASGNDDAPSYHPTKIDKPKHAPTLDFSRGSSPGFTDPIGNVYKQQYKTKESESKPEPTPESEPIPSPEKPAEKPSEVPAETPSTTIAQQGYVQATIPAVKADAVDAEADPKAYTTIYSTSGHAVIEKVIVLTEVTVTAGAAETPVVKRRHAHHLHQHQHGARHARH